MFQFEQFLKKGLTVFYSSGDMGNPIMIDKNKLSPQERKKYDQGWKDNQFNLYASDMIGIRRNLPDMRHKE